MAGGVPFLFEVFRGDDFTLRVEVTDAQDNTVDIRGWAFKATMKLNTEAPDKDAPVKVDIGPLPDSDNDAENGVMHVVMPSDQTRNLKPTTYFFDLQRESSATASTVSTIVMGRVQVRADVTRREG